jgi:hypothetical protein
VVPTSDRPQQDSHPPSTPTALDVHWQDDHIVQQHEQRVFQLEKLLRLKPQVLQSDPVADFLEKNIRRHQAEAFQLMLDLAERASLSLLAKLAPVLR